MKLTATLRTRSAWTLAALSIATGCSGPATPTPVPTPSSTSTTTTSTTSTPAGAVAAPPAPIGEVERTEFNPSLNVKLQDMVRRASGLYVQDLQMGTGGVAVRGRTVIIRYAGWLANGKPFDSGEITVTLGSNKTIRAWEEGLLGMRVGGRRRIVSPPTLAYGSRGSGDVIPPNAVLVFEMELISVM